MSAVITKALGGTKTLKLNADACKHPAGSNVPLQLHVYKRLIYKQVW